MAWEIDFGTRKGVTCSPKIPGKQYTFVIETKLASLPTLASIENLGRPLQRLFLTSTVTYQTVKLRSIVHQL